MGEANHWKFNNLRSISWSIRKAILKAFPETFVKGFPEAFTTRHFFKNFPEHSLMWLKYFTRYFEMFSLNHTPKTFSKRIPIAFSARCFLTHSSEHSLRHLNFLIKYSAKFYSKHTPYFPFLCLRFQKKSLLLYMEKNMIIYSGDLSCSILSLLKYENSFFRSYFCYRKAI